MPASIARIIISFITSVHTIGIITFQNSGMLLCFWNANEVIIVAIASYSNQHHHNSTKHSARGELFYNACGYEFNVNGCTIRGSLIFLRMPHYDRVHQLFFGCCTSFNIFSRQHHQHCQCEHVFDHGNQLHYQL